MVLDYLVKNGNKEPVVKCCRNKISCIQKLEDFQFVDKDCIDRGIIGKLLSCYCDMYWLAQFQ